MSFDYAAYPILFVDDEPANLVALSYVLEGKFRVLTAGSGDEALQTLATHDDIAIIVCDQRMPGMTGVEVCERARIMRPNVVRMILTAYADLHDAIERELSEQIHVGVRLLTPGQWQTLLESAGLSVTAKRIAPMHLLEPRRIIRDEGIAGALRFGVNLLLYPEARRRVMAMRCAFRRYANHLRAIALVARKNVEART